MLDTSLESVTSASSAPRATMKSRRPKGEPPPLPDSPQERRLVGRLAAAFEASDVDGLVALLAEDVRLTCPVPARVHRSEAAARFYTIVVGARPGLRAVTRANGKRWPRTAPDPTANVFRATSLLVVTSRAGGSARSPASTPGCSCISGCLGSFRAE